MSTTSFEDAARARKVAELYGVARARGYSAAQVATDDALRAELVAAAGVHEPSDRTWGLLVGALDEAERHDARLVAKHGAEGQPFEAHGHNARLIGLHDACGANFNARCDCGWSLGLVGTARWATDLVLDHLASHAFQTDAEVDIAGAIEDLLAAG